MAFAGVDLVRIVSTTLAGTAADAGIGYALASVAPFVDAHIIICTRPDGKHPEIPAGCTDKPINWHQRPWDNDCGSARNAALEFAADCNADWAITLDNDERIETHGEDVRAELQRIADAGGCGVLSIEEDETYAKPRAIRLNSGVHWSGRTHETIHVQQPSDLHTFSKLRFSEETKTSEDNAVKFALTCELLRLDLADSPKDTRAWYYLGASLHGTGDIEGAIKAYKQCALLDGWYEESAWACYRAAILLAHLDRPAEALECIAAGMRRDAGMAELPALAAVVSLHLGRTEQARCYAEIARLHGPGSLAFARRLGFRDGATAKRCTDEVLTALQSPAKV